MAWYNKSAEEVILELNTSAGAGLSEQNAAHRRERYGINQTSKRKTEARSPGITPGSVMPSALLAVASLLCLFTKSYTAAAVALGGALITAALKYSLSVKINRVLDRIGIVTARMQTVIRDSSPEIIETKALVPGDIVLLRAGDIIGADMRIIEAIDLVIDESILPDGFMRAHKFADVLVNDEAPLSEHVNMCYTGTVVSSGGGRAVVVETGSSIAAPFAVRSPYEYERRSAINKLISKQNKRFTVLGIIICAAALLVGLLMQEMSTANLTKTILFALALSAAVIPAGLGLIEAQLSAASIKKLALRGTIVKSLDTMDRLSRVDTILVQKTGVISSDEMTATVIWTGGHLIDVRGRGYTPDGRFLDASGAEIDVSRNRSLSLTLIGGVLCGNSYIEETSGSWVYHGDPTECALITLAAKAGLNRADVAMMFPRIAEIPFEPERRMMTTVHKRGRHTVAYTKGSPETVLGHCTEIKLGEISYILSDQTREQLKAVYTRMAEQGLRIIAVAYREFSEDPSSVSTSEIEKELTFCGFVGIDNRAKSDSVAAFNLGAAAGIRTVIVTGDLPETAADLALSIGISGDMLEGGEIDNMASDELYEKIRTARVCGGVTPSGKQLIVSALKRSGAVVAVTGTRAADASALLTADLGISVGSGASELTRDTADVILEDADYAGIIRLVEESRRSFTALRSYCNYVVLSFTSIMLAVFMLLISSATPIAQFSMTQLVWLGIVLSLIPAFVIGREAAEREVMRQPPRGPTDAVINRLTIISALIQSALPAIFTVAAFFIARGRATAAGISEEEIDVYSRTAAFITLTLSLLFMAHSNRSERTSIIRLGIMSNRPLTAVTVGFIAVMLFAVYVPVLRGVFDTAAIGFVEWFTAFAAALLSLVWCEIYKGLIRPTLAKNIRERKPDDKDIEGSFSERFFAKFEGDDPTQEDIEPTLREKRRAKKAAKEAAKEAARKARPADTAESEASESFEEVEDTAAEPVPLEDTAKIVVFEDENAVFDEGADEKSEEDVLSEILSGDLNIEEIVEKLMQGVEDEETIDN